MKPSLCAEFLPAPERRSPPFTVSSQPHPCDKDRRYLPVVPPSERPLRLRPLVEHGLLQPVQDEPRLEV